MNYRRHSNYNKKVKSQFYSLLLKHSVISPRSTMYDVKGHA